MKLYHALIPPLALLVLAWAQALEPGWPTATVLLRAAVLMLAVLSAVHHAEVVAHRTGEPLGTLVLALAASGLNGQSFAFHGYLPTDASDRAARIKQLEQRSRQEKQTQILIETPYRNEAMLEALATHCAGNTLVCVATDLTLDSESVVTKSASAWKQAIAGGKMPAFRKKPTVFLFLA